MASGQARAVTVALQKGGVGKTAISINLAERLAARGNETLLVDLDQQGNATEGVGLDDAYSQSPHLGDVLTDGVAPSEVIQPAAGDTDFDVLPAHRDLDETENKVRTSSLGFLWLRRRVIEPLLGDRYGYIVVDSPPQIGPLSDMAIVGAQNVVVPLIGAEEAVAGMERLIRQQVGPLREEMDVEILAIVPNMTTSDNEEKRIIEGLEATEQFASKLPRFARSELYDDPSEMDPGIRKRIEIRRAWRDGVPLATYDPDNDVLERFDELAQVVEQGEVA